MRLGVLTMALIACSEGSSEEDATVNGGAYTDTGTTQELPGESTSGGMGVVWVDANGEVVEGAVELGGRLRYVDDDGWWWPLDPWGSGEAAFVPGSTGELLDLWGDEVAGLYFADDACTSPALRAPGVPAGFVVIAVSWLGGPGVPADYERTTWALTGEARATTPTQLWAEDSCVAVGGEDVFTSAGVIEVAAPSAWWTAPLHPELR